MSENTDEFDKVTLELGVLIATVLILGLTLAVLRRRRSSD